MDDCRLGWTCRSGKPSKLVDTEEVVSHDDRVAVHIHGKQQSTCVLSPKKRLFVLSSSCIFAVAARFNLHIARHAPAAR